MDAFQQLEALNVAICREAGAGRGHDTTREALAAYDRIMASRAAEVREAIAAARKVRPKSAFVDGIEAALARALASPRGTPGQAAYEEDMRRRPVYHDGTPRKPWADLGESERWSWERNPTPREWSAAARAQEDQAVTSDPKTIAAARIAETNAAHKAAWDAYAAECLKVCGKRAMPDAIYLRETAKRTPELAKLAAALHVAGDARSAAWEAYRAIPDGAA